MKKSILIVRITRRWREASLNKKIAAGAIPVIVAFTITPLCGLWFACGCTWPGLGLDSFCNINNPGSRHQCPWCASQWAGFLSVGLSASAGTIASGCSIWNYKDRKIFEVFVRIVFGTFLFFMTACLFGLLAAFLQNYPLGFRSLFR